MNEEKYSYYRIIPIERSDTLLLEKVAPHSFALKGLIGIRKVRKKPHVMVSFPQSITEWFAERGLLEYFPRHVLVIIPFNIDSVTDIDVLMDIAKALYGFKDARELYREKIKAGKIKPVEAGLDPHYRLFLNAKTFTKIPINTLYDMLREASSEEVEDSTL